MPKDKVKSEERVKHMKRIARYYVAESTSVLSDPRDFPPETVALAQQIMKASK